MRERERERQRQRQRQREEKSVSSDALHHMHAKQRPPQEDAGKASEKSSSHLSSLAENCGGWGWSNWIRMLSIIIMLQRFVCFLERIEGGFHRCGSCPLFQILLTCEILLLLLLLLSLCALFKLWIRPWMDSCRSESLISGSPWCNHLG